MDQRLKPKSQHAKALERKHRISHNLKEGKDFLAPENTNLPLPAPQKINLYLST